jgi:hypothetical protein
VVSEPRTSDDYEEPVKRLISLVTVLLLSLQALAACGLGNSPRVLIKSSMPRGSGPYTLKIDAYDNTTGQPLQAKEEPVVGEYGPASLEYPSGHNVELTVRMTPGGGIKVPMSSWIRLTDGGIGGKEKSCFPADSQHSSMECKLTTRY